MADQITNVANAFETTLSASLSATDLTINVDSTAGSPDLPFYLVLDPGVDATREIVLVDGSKTATSFVLSGLASRGVDGTTAIIHDFGAAVGIYPVAAHWKDINDRVDGVRTDLAVGTGLRQIVTFTANGTFSKGDYPWLTAVRVRMVGGGGGGGGAPGAGTGAAAGSGGGGGAYAEARFAASALASSETVTVGAAGSGGVAATTDPTNGGTSSFGTLLTAQGGWQGANGVNTTGANSRTGGVGGSATTGASLEVWGGDGGNATVVDGVVQFPGATGGAGAVLGTERRSNASASAHGLFGHQYGGGGTGAYATTADRNGGEGRHGVVIVELYA
jgi:hypothetical protein